MYRDNSVYFSHHITLSGIVNRESSVVQVSQKLFALVRVCSRLNNLHIQFYPHPAQGLTGYAELINVIYSLLNSSFLILSSFCSMLKKSYITFNFTFYILHFTFIIIVAKLVYQFCLILLNTDDQEYSLIAASRETGFRRDFRRFSIVTLKIVIYAGTKYFTGL